MPDSPPPNQADPALVANHEDPRAAAKDRVAIRKKLAAQPEPDDVPDELMDLAWRAELARRLPGVSPKLVEEYCDFESYPSMRSQREELRPIVAAVAPAIRQAERAKVAAELEALRDGVANADKPYNEAFVHALDCAIRQITRGEAR